MSESSGSREKPAAVPRPGVDRRNAERAHVLVQGVRLPVGQVGPHGAARAQAHGRATVCLPPVPRPLLPEARPGTPRALAHGREAVPLPRVQRTICSAVLAGSARAQAGLRETEPVVNGSFCAGVMVQDEDVFYVCMRACALPVVT